MYYSQSPKDQTDLHLHALITQIDRSLGELAALTTRLAIRARRQGRIQAKKYIV